MTDQERTAAQKKWVHRSAYYTGGQIEIAYERAEEVDQRVTALADEVMVSKLAKADARSDLIELFRRMDSRENTVVTMKGEIQRLEDAHAALEAKVDRWIKRQLSANSEQLKHIAELSAKVEALRESQDDWTHLTHARLTTASQRIAALEPPATPAPDPVCPIPDCNPQSCNRAYCYVTDSVGAGIVPTAEPDPAPLDPVDVIMLDVLEYAKEYEKAERYKRDGHEDADRYATSVGLLRVRVQRAIRAYGKDGAR